MKGFYQWNKKFILNKGQEQENTEEEPPFLDPVVTQKQASPQLRTKFKRFIAHRDSKSHQKTKTIINPKQQPTVKQTIIKQQPLEVDSKMEANLFKNKAIKCHIESGEGSKDNLKRIHHKSQPKCVYNQKKPTLKHYLESQLAHFQEKTQKRYKYKRAIEVVSRSLHSQQRQTWHSSQKFYTIGEEPTNQYINFGNYIMKRTSHDKFGKKWVNGQLIERQKTEENREEKKRISKELEKEEKGEKARKSQEYLIISPLAISILKLKKYEKKRGLSYRSSHNANLSELSGRKEQIFIDKRNNSLRKYETII